MKFVTIALLLSGCAAYDQTLLDSKSCAINPSQVYSFQLADVPDGEAKVGLPSEYVPKCCSSIQQQCDGGVLTISCRDYVETWTVLDQVDGGLYVSVENRTTGVAEFHTLKAVPYDQDGGR